MSDEHKSESAAKSGRRFDETYKRHAVELTLNPDRTVESVARELGISTWSLRQWRKRYAPGPGGGAAVADLKPEEKDEEIRRLRAELVRMREREIVLKKSLGILSETPGSGMPGSRR